MRILWVAFSSAGIDYVRSCTCVKYGTPAWNLLKKKRQIFFWVMCPTCLFRAHCATSSQWKIWCEAAFTLIVNLALRKTGKVFVCAQKAQNTGFTGTTNNMDSEVVPLPDCYRRDTSSCEQPCWKTHSRLTEIIAKCTIKVVWRTGKLVTVFFVSWSPAENVVYLSSFWISVLQINQNLSTLVRSTIWQFDRIVHYKCRQDHRFITWQPQRDFESHFT